MRRFLLVLANILATIAVGSLFAALGMRSAGLPNVGVAWAAMWWAAGMTMIVSILATDRGVKK